jgi:hypothetical protein
MTTAYILSQKRRPSGKHVSTDTSLYLLMILLGLLTLFFVFGTRSEPVYEKQSFNGNEVTTNNKIEKADPATMYKAIVTNGDAIRSVLQ